MTVSFKNLISLLSSELKIFIWFAAVRLKVVTPYINTTILLCTSSFTD